MIHWRQLSLIDGGAPKSAEICGLGKRYRFWAGESGRRYLFTAVSAAEIADFGNAIAVLARGNARDGFAGVEVSDLSQAGEAMRLSARMAGDPGLSGFVHLLAASAEEREAIVADLAGQVEALAA